MVHKPFTRGKLVGAFASVDNGLHG